jgi:hypothetical protein
MQVLHSLQDIPAFANEDEEDEFWSTHALGEELWDEMKPVPEGELPPPRAATTSISIPLDEPIVTRIKALARRRHTRYQLLLREFVTERLAEEERRLASGE